LGCQPVANLAFDPYLGVATEGGAGSPPLFESLLASAHALLPAGTTLPQGTSGLDGATNGVTGSATTPVTADSFAAGYCDETQLSQYDPTSTPTCPASVPVIYTSAEENDLCALDPQLKLSSVPAGTVDETAPTGYTNQGVGLPFVAIYPQTDVTQSTSGVVTFSGSPVLSAVPVSVLYANYQAAPGTFGPSQSSPSGPQSLHAVITFSLTSYILSESNPAGALVGGTTYIAYLLLQDTDQSGPLADHIWYFQP